MGSQSTAADCSAACHAAADFRCKFFSFGRGSCRASVTPGSSTDLTTASETPAGCPCLAESTASDSAEWAGGCVEGFTETADYDFYEVTAPPAKPPTCDRRIPPDGPEAWGRLALSASCVGAALHGSKACSRADRALVLGYALLTLPPTRNPALALTLIYCTLHFCPPALLHFCTSRLLHFCISTPWP